MIDSIDIKTNWTAICEAIQGDKETQPSLDKAAYEKMIAELNVSIPSSIPATLSDVAENIEDLGHGVGAFTGHVPAAGPIGTILSSVVDAGPILYHSFKNKQLPNRQDAVKLGVAAVSVVLAGLALTLVGGPIGAGIFALGIAVLGVVKIVQKIRATRTALADITEKMTALKKDIDHDLINFDTLKADQKIALSQKMKAYVAYGYQRRTLKQNLPIHKVAGPVMTASSIVFCIGAVLSMTPLAPIGVGLMLGSAIAAAVTTVVTWGAMKIKQYQARKNTEKSVEKKEEPLSTQPLMADKIDKTIGYSLSIIEKAVGTLQKTEIKALAPLEGRVTLEKIEDKRDDVKRIEYDIEIKAGALTKLKLQCDALKDQVTEIQDAGITKRFTAITEILYENLKALDGMREKMQLAHAELDEMLSLKTQKTGNKMYTAESQNKKKTPKNMVDQVQKKDDAGDDGLER